jgi:predicted CoA-substrate-specific enzyme activase
MNKLYIGIDIGSISTDICIVNEDSEILATGIEQSGVNGAETARLLLSSLLKNLQYPENSTKYIVTTGYGRRMFKEADKVVTEITCHAIGAKHLFPETDTILDIGGQDSKAIKIDPQGRVIDFQMNDKCAAGSGRFVEVMAKILQVNLDELNNLYFEPGEAARINSTCTVFTESEVISFLTDGVPISSIVKGIFGSIADRSKQLLSFINPGKNLTLSGGVCKNIALVEEIKKTFDGVVNLPENPQIIGALGAALLAKNPK